MSPYKKLFKSTFIFSIGNIGSKLITFLMLPLYSDVFTNDEFGEIDLILTAVTLLIPLMTVNIVEGIIRFSLDKKYYSSNTVLSNGIVFVIIGFILLVCFYPLLARIDFISNHINYFYLIFLVIALQTIIKEFVRTIELNYVYMISDLLYTVSFVSLNLIFLLYLDANIIGYLSAIIIANIINIFYLAYKSKAISYIRFQYINKKTLTNMFIYSIPLMPNAIMWWVVNLSDRYLLLLFLGTGATGIYAMANRFPVLISTMYLIFYKAWQISAIEEYDSLDKNKYYSNVFNIVFFGLIISISLYIPFNKTIISLYLSNEFFEVWKYIPILMLGVVFSSLSSFMGINYIASKKTRGAFYTTLIGAILNVIFNILLIPLYGILGAAISTSVSYLLLWVIRMYDTKKYVQIEYSYLKISLSIILVVVQIITDMLLVSSILTISLHIFLLIGILVLSFEYIKVPLLVGKSKLKTRLQK